MNIEEFIANFAAQLDETDPESITAETRFKELDEWSSLTALSIIAMVDDEYDVIIKESQVKEIIARVLNIPVASVSCDLSSGDIPEWDSVGNLAILSTLEQELGIEFPLEDLFDLTDVKSIVEEVIKLTDD